MEKVPTPTQQGNKETTEFNGQQFKVERPNALSVSDIYSGDRVFITTESGNRYMLRRSKSAGGVIKIYNEKADGFKYGYELISQENIAKVGSELDFIVRVSQDKGQKYHATSVTGIEIRRGIDDAIEKNDEKNDNDVGQFGKILAKSIIKRSHAKESPSKGDDADFFDEYIEK